ncbi:MAG: right-handed parallel beta-helix repeat-containing protein, partial [Bacteroidota bacterium]
MPNRLFKPSPRSRCACSFFFLLLLSFGLQAREIHVDPSGNDGNAGTAAAPYATIGKAAAVAVAGDVVIIHAGTYEETLRPANSGTPGNPIVFRSAAGEKVIITAMASLSGFTSDGGGRYKKTVTWDLGQKNFVMNGTTAMDLARWPNNTDGDPFTLNSRRNTGGSGPNVSTGAFLTHNEIPNWNWAGGSILFYGDKPGSGWTTWKAFITSSSSGRVNFNLIKNQSWIRTFHAPSDKGDYFLEGIKQALDYQNEWWFNASTKTLFVQLPGGNAPAPGQVQMRRRDMTVNLDGRNHIHLENLAVFGGGVSIQGAGNRLYGVSSFYGNYTRGVSPDMASGNRSIDIKSGSSNTVIERCEIAFGSGAGIWDSGNGTVIENCYIHDFNFLGVYDGPIMARNGNATTIRKNT